MTAVTLPTTAPPTIIRRLRGYCCEWGHYFPSGVMGDDYSQQFAFMPDAFDAAIVSGQNIRLTQDLDGIPLASTADNTLRLTSDETDLWVEAVLVDTQRNRDLIRAIDCG